MMSLKRIARRFYAAVYVWKLLHVNKVVLEADLIGLWFLFMLGGRLSCRAKKSRQIINSFEWINSWRARKGSTWSHRLHQMSSKRRKFISIIYALSVKVLINNGEVVLESIQTLWSQNSARLRAAVNKEINSGNKLWTGHSKRTWIINGF